MARWEFKLPDIGEGVAEGEIVAWRVAAGDVVREDQPVVELMTDKATVTITAPRAGTVVETRGAVGETVAVHAVLVVFEIDDRAAPQAARPEEPRSGVEARLETISRPPQSNGTRTHPANGRDVVGSGEPPPRVAGPSATAPAAHAGASGYFNAKPLATPATRKLARAMNVDLRRVRPSGPQGRVTRSDVQAFGDSGALARPEGEPRRAGAPPAEERAPFAGLRRRIATKMALATSKAAHFTFVEECDVSQLKALRERLKPEAAERGVKLTFLPFIVKAVVASLKKHPMLNTSLDEAAQEIVFHKAHSIGIATATDAGLMVPVVKNAGERTLLGIAREIERLAEDARAGKAKLEDLQGSTFTITSLGPQGGLLATPIVNFPEVAILGVHRMKQRPIVRSGQIVVGDIMLLSLSFDHRIVDGHVGAAFAYDVIGYLEQPERLLLEMA